MQTLQLMKMKIKQEWRDNNIIILYIKYMKNDNLSCKRQWQAVVFLKHVP